MLKIIDFDTEGTWQNQNSNHFESVMEMPLIPVPGVRDREIICEFKTRLVYIVPAMATY